MTVEITCVCSTSAHFVIKKLVQNKCLSQIKETYCKKYIGLVFLLKMHNIITKPLYFFKTPFALFVCFGVGGSDPVDLSLPLNQTTLHSRVVMHYAM